MKRLALLAGAAVLSTSAMAEIGLKVELGYEAATIAPSYGDCWSECFGDGEPAGAALNIEWQVMGVEGLYIAADIAALEDEEDHYDDEVEITQDRTALEVGYDFALNDTATLTAALRYADTEWEYKWTDQSNAEYTYEAEDDGVSLILGASKAVTDSVEVGTAFSAGFETGIEVYAAMNLTEQLAVKAAWSKNSYELGDHLYTSNGTPSTPSTDNNDGDVEFDTDTLRISGSYSF